MYAVKLTNTGSRCVYTKNNKRIALSNIDKPHRNKMQVECLRLKSSIKKAPFGKKPSVKTKPIVSLKAIRKEVERRADDEEVLGIYTRR